MASGFEPMEWLSDVIEFPGDQRETPENKIQTVPYVCHETRTATVWWQPTVPFIIQECEIVSGPADAEMTLDIDMVMVGNRILTAFTRKHPPCHTGYGIRVDVAYKGRAPCHCQIRIRGVGFHG